MTEAVEYSKRLRRTLRAARRAAERKRAPEKPTDVWHWTSGRYRVRSVVLLLVNALLFVGLGTFTFWLRTGELPFFNPGYATYWWGAFDFSGEDQVTLIDYLTYPIPVDQVPMMRVIVGLVLATLTAIPILVSMLYRFPFALIFIFILAFVAVLPWLAICVTLCCYLARWKPIQFSFRYATALISMLPLVAYYVLATRNPSAPEQLPPVEIAKLYIPWVLALVLACVVMGIVLLIARLVNYRPGAIAPLMAIMFALPVALFEAEVGRDELSYRLLEDHYGPGPGSYFEDLVDARPAIEAAARDLARERGDDPEALANLHEQVHLWLTLTNESFAALQNEAVETARRFRERFPNSRYVPNALYLEGRALDLRVDRELFRKEQIVRYYETFPNAASKPVWRELHDRFPDETPAAEGTYRLALLEARGGNVDEAVALLDDLIERFRDDARRELPLEEVTGWWRLVAKRPAAGMLRVNIARTVQEARKLRDLLVHNRDPEQGDQALRDLLSCDPRHPLYRQNLKQLLRDIPRRYPLTRLEDNLKVLLAAANPSLSEKISELRRLIDELAEEPYSDALPRAWFELGSAYETDNLPERAGEAYQRLVDQYPDSPWAIEARSRLAAMGAIGLSRG